MNRTAQWGYVALGVTTLIYAPVLIELGRDWIRDPNYSHGVLIPLISAYLIWKQRQRLRALPLHPSNIGLVGIIGSLALFIIGSAGAEVFTQRVSFIGLLFSGVVFFAGWSWVRVVAFPLGLLLLAIPLPYVIYYSLTSPLQTVAAKAALGGLKLLGIPVMAQGNVILLPDIEPLYVEEACSGIRSLYSIVSFGALIAYWTPLPFWGRALVFSTTIPLSIVANAFRVWATCLGAYLVGPWVTEGVAHDFFGLIVFGGALVAFLLIRKGVRLVWSSVPSSPSRSSQPQELTPIS